MCLGGNKFVSKSGQILVLPPHSKCCTAYAAFHFYVEVGISEFQVRCFSWRLEFLL